MEVGLIADAILTTAQRRHRKEHSTKAYSVFITGECAHSELIDDWIGLRPEPPKDYQVFIDEWRNAGFVKASASGTCFAISGATIPAASVTAESTQEIESTLNELLADWREETGHLSSITEKAMHPAYQRIIGLGPRAIPALLRELQRTPDHLFWALKAITGADPVDPTDRGNLEAMVFAWVRWGKRQRHL